MLWAEAHSNEATVNPAAHAIPITENDRNRIGRCFGCIDRKAATESREHAHLTVDQIGGEPRQAVRIVIRPANIDRQVLAFDIVHILEPLAGAPLCNSPITGIACCCARAASGHAAALPSPAMNSRRRILDPSRLDQRTLSQ
jgi:hypothetical protein